MPLNGIFFITESTFRGAVANKLDQAIDFGISQAKKKNKKKT